MLYLRTRSRFSILRLHVPTHVSCRTTHESFDRLVGRQPIGGGTFRCGRQQRRTSLDANYRVLRAACCVLAAPTGTVVLPLGVWTPMCPRTARLLELSKRSRWRRAWVPVQVRRTATANRNCCCLGNLWLLNPLLLRVCQRRKEPCAVRLAALVKRACLPFGKDATAMPRVRLLSHVQTPPQVCSIGCLPFP